MNCALCIALGVTVLARSMLSHDADSEVLSSGLLLPALVGNCASSEGVMGFWDCRREDPFTRLVRELYCANVVRAPRAGIRPLQAVARSDKRVEMLGDFAALLSGNEPPDLPPITTSAAAQFAGTRSAKVEAGLAAKFLGALGLPLPAIELDSSLWKGASGFAFEVRDVQECQVEISRLGRAIKGRVIDRNHPAAAMFFKHSEIELHIITRTLTSPHVLIFASSEAGQSIELSSDKIDALIGKTDSKVQWRREAVGAVSFHGTEAVTFAIAAVPCNLRTDGSFTFGLETRDTSYLDTPTTSRRPLLVATHLPLVDRDGLLDLDSLEEVTP